MIAPSLEVSETFVFLGWSVSKDSKEVQYIVGDSILLSDDANFYPVILALKENQVKLTATFYGLLDEKKIVTCVSDGNGCTVEVPEILSDDYEILGYSKVKNSFSTDVSFGDSIVLTENVDYYVVKGDIKNEEEANQYVQYSAEFDSNGAEISDSSVTCFKDKKCIIKVPTISRDGYEIIGFSTNKDSKKAEIKSGEVIELTKNMKYYAITKKNKITYTANFSVGNAISVGTSKLTCQTEEVYNREEFKNRCMIKMPTIRAYEQFNTNWMLENHSDIQYFVN